MSNFFKNQWYKLPKGVRLFLLRKFVYLKNFINEVFDIKEGSDPVGTIENIRQNVKIKGSNVWILIAGAMLASIGLDTNSSAVIIGAMLISPLMNPILGIGLSVGINDKELLSSSLKNFIIAIIASLLTSYIYFIITPLGEPTAELKARIKPTILDVLVALFGGIAGIVANSRKEKSNAIPGVAIATALMPPICTAGFGLAKNKMDFFLGAFYLFFLNAVFISLSTYIIVKYLKFPVKSFASIQAKRRVYLYIYSFIIIVIIPSAIIFYNVIKEVRIQKYTQNFFDKKVNSVHRKILSWEIIDKDSLLLIKAYLTGNNLPSDSLMQLQKEFEQNSPISDTKLEIIQTELNPEIQQKLEASIKRQILQAIKVNKEVQLHQQHIIDSLKNVIKILKSDTFPVVQLTKEVKTFIKDIKKFSIVKSVIVSSDSLNKDTIAAALVKFSKFPKNRYLRRKQQENIYKLKKFLTIRLNLDTLVIVKME